MNKGLGERDAVFLAEMGLAPLWRLRAAPDTAHEVHARTVEAVDAVVDALDAAAAALAAGMEASTVRIGAPASAAPAPADALGQSPADAPAPAPAPARGPSPLQRVAQSASALEPVAPPPANPDAAWDDAVAPDATPQQIAAMDWDGLQLAMTNCRRCGACRDGRLPVPGTGAKRARWLVAAGASTAADDKARLPLAGDAGKLLDNMLAAVGMARGTDVYITNLVKCRPTTASGAERAPTAEEAAACRPYLERELVLSGAGTVLTLGQIAANTLLGRPLAEPLAGARGAVHALGIVVPPSEDDAAPQAHCDLRLVATLHPGELLRRGADKAQAWADLCRARRNDRPGEAGGAPGAGPA